MRNYLLGLLFFTVSSTSLANQDSDFIAARQAFQTGNAKALENHAKKLQRHPLRAYVDYYQLRLVLPTTDSATIRSFLARYDGSLVADRLRGDWLKVLAKSQQWPLFDGEHPAVVNKDPELTCYIYQRRLDLQDTAVIPDARALWFTSTSLPDSCTPVFQSLIFKGELPIEDIWTRIRITLEDGQTGAAMQASRYISGDQGLDLGNLNAAAKNPLRYLEDQTGKIRTHSDREIALFALLRLLRNDTDQAFAQWQKIKDQLTIPNRSYFLAKLGHRAAMRHDTRALSWFKEAQNTTQSYPPSDTVLGWQVRAALRVQDWNEVLAAINRMSPTEQQVDTWRYWKARALLATGDSLSANNMLIPLSKEHSFYGQLAREELGTLLAISDQTYKVSNGEIAAMEKKPGVQRTLALSRMNMRIEALREWSWTIRNFTDAELLAAAEVARRQGLYDRAINTANRTVSKHDFNLRFLAPHRATVKKVLQQHELDEAWVYGLIRQESRFIADIKSHAGAIGLMQLMPSTADWVAKQLGIKNFRHSIISDVNTNLRLGTYYLKHVLSTLDNQPLLASAAYNAGPGRAKRWRDDYRVLEGAIYAETIPFNETRDYVKKVLKNSMYYAKVLNHGNGAPTLKERLGTIAPKP